MTDYEQQLQAWRDRRIATLTAPDGWLSVVGLHWLSLGDNRIGSAGDNDLIVPQLPPHAGTVTLWPDGAASIVLAPATGGRIDGSSENAAVLLTDADRNGPTLVHFGDVSFFVIARTDGKALRVKDPNSATRTSFAGIDTFPVDPSWRIEADWVALKTSRDFEIESLAGGSNTIPVSHKAVFSHDGQAFELWPTHGSANVPMFVLRDATSGKQTYGACRFLIGEVTGDRVVLDFNKAINPPCAFTDFATCPLPPPENILPLRIEAGELYTPHS